MPAASEKRKRRQRTQTRHMGVGNEGITSELLHPLSASAFKRVVIALVHFHFPAKNQHDAIAYSVEEVAVV